MCGPKRPECGAQLGGEKRWLLPGSKMTAFVDLVEVGQVAIGAPGPRLRGLIALARKDRDGHRQRDLRGLLGTRKGGTAPAILPVKPRRGGGAVRQPVQRDVVQHLVAGLFGVGVVEFSMRET